MLNAEELKKTTAILDADPRMKELEIKALILQVSLWPLFDFENDFDLSSRLLGLNRLSTLKLQATLWLESACDSHTMFKDSKGFKIAWLGVLKK